MGILGKFLNRRRAMPTDFLMEVAKGNIHGHTSHMHVAHASGVGTTKQTLWEEGGIYVFPTSASTMTLSSDSTDDVNTTGTGAWTVLVEGLDTNYAAISETVNLNGQNGVTTSNSYLRVNHLTVVTAGTGTNNAGTVYMGTGTITTGKPAVVYGIMDPESSGAHMGVYTPAAGTTAYLTNLIFTVSALKDAEILFCLRAPTTNAAWLEATSFDLSGSTVPNPGFGFTIPATYDVRFDAVLSTSTGNIKTTMQLLIVDSNVDTMFGDPT